MALESLDVPVDKCEIVCQDPAHIVSDQGELSFTCVRPRAPFDYLVGRIGDLLEQLGRGEPLDEPRVVIPVGLCRRSPS